MFCFAPRAPVQAGMQNTSQISVGAILENPKPRDGIRVMYWPKRAVVLGVPRRSTVVPALCACGVVCGVWCVLFTHSKGARKGSSAQCAAAVRFEGMF